MLDNLTYLPTRQTSILAWFLRVLGKEKFMEKLIDGLIEIADKLIAIIRAKDFEAAKKYMKGLDYNMYGEEQRINTIKMVTVVTKNVHELAEERKPLVEEYKRLYDLLP